MMYIADLFEKNKNLPTSIRIAGYTMAFRAMLENVQAALNNKDTTKPQIDPALEAIIKKYYPKAPYTAHDIDLLISQLEAYREKLPDPSQERTNINNAITYMRMAEMLIGPGDHDTYNIQQFLYYGWKMLSPYLPA